jgi:phosphatidylserine/phosphatidylglycerophosphate/cardiolipin synthase-like enzyme
MKEDLGGKPGPTSRAENLALQKKVAGLLPTPVDFKDIPVGVTPVFSPRAGGKVLDMYVSMVDSALKCSCITLAFGINKLFKDRLLDNTGLNHLVFMLLEKRDVKNPKSTSAFVPLRAAHNVYQAWGAFMKDPVYQWARETNAMRLKLNMHVVYVHSKFLLMDPLGKEPTVVTGSANFSKASTNDNDENMLLIKGDRRVADIYFTEFNRLFNHYYFRSVTEALKETGKTIDSSGSLFLEEEAKKWLDKYKAGSLKSKRLNLFVEMESAETLPVP